MKRQFEQHRQKDRVRFSILAFVLFLVTLTVVGMCLQLFGNGKVKPSEWFKKNDKQIETSADENDNADGKLEVVETAAQSNSVALTATPLRAVRSTRSVALLDDQGQQAASLLDDGISTQANTTPIATSTVTATVSPTGVQYQSIDWNLSWVDGSTPTISNYLAVTGSSDLSKTLECYQAFTKQACLTVIVWCYDGSFKQASCTVDYRDRVTGISSIQLFRSNNPNSETISNNGAPRNIDIYDINNYKIDYNIGNLSYWTSGGSVANNNAPSTHSSTFKSIKYEIFGSSYNTVAYIDTNSNGITMKLDFYSALYYGTNAAFASGVKSESGGKVNFKVTFTLSNNQTVQMLFCCNFNQNVSSVSMNSSGIVF